MKVRMDQVRVIAFAELRRNLITRRGLWIYLLAAMPVGLAWAHTVGAWMHGSRHGVAAETQTLAHIFEFFMLRLVVFFGCVGLFTRLFRAEILERSLHYYFLAPVRREVLLTGKFIAGLITACIIFCGMTLATFAGFYGHYSSATIEQFLFEGGGLAHLFSYLGVTAFACAGYGAVFLTAGMMFRNPVFPAIGVMLWEGVSVFFPSTLQKLTVIFYVRSLMPVDPPAGRGDLAKLFAVLAEPMPAYIAIPGLLAVTAAMLFIAARAARRMEISYAAD
jgi:ABC-type transport system involved in multi-copper enzyme maturation permease subunit